MLDPKIDLVFKKIFCKPGNEQALLDFINLIFANEGLPLIRDLHIVNPRIEGDSLQQKAIVIDIHAITTDGEVLVIEMQMTNRKAFRERLVYYWGKGYVGQLKKGQDYSELKRTVVIGLLNFSLTDEPALHSVYQLMERKRHVPLMEQLEIHLIELPKLGRAPEIAGTPLGNWLQFLNGAPEAEWAELAIADESLRKVMMTLKELSSDAEQRSLALAREIGMLDYLTDLNAARREGKAEGEAKGEAEGKAEGKAEATQMFVLTLLQKGFDPTVISELSGLPIDQVIVLKESLSLKD
jgi:predicted transposase/invertase (TIGR01784 family)